MIETSRLLSRRLLFVFLLFAILHLNTQAQQWSDTVQYIENIMARYTPENPGCQLAISRNGTTLFSKAYGMADLEHRVALTINSVIEAGSVSKQFTAAAILLLEQEGKLSLSDDVHKYIPELPEYGYPVTLRQMMQHTSGLKDWGSVAAIAGWPRTTKTYSNADALEIIVRQKSLNHIPGDEYLYSNSNYNLFAIIVERVSGQSLAEFTRRRIFEPAGMVHTEWRDDFRKIVPNRAIAYGFEKGRFYTDMPNEYVYGNGGLLTTAEDLLAWNNYYINGKLGQPSLLPKQIQTNPFNNGLPGRYGAGLRVDSLLGRKVITHSGATASYRANLDYFPDLGLSIAWISNSAQFDGHINPAATAIRNLLVKNIGAAQVASAKKPVISDSALFRDLKDGNARMLPVIQGKPMNTPEGNWIPVAPAKTDSLSLKEFTGIYYSEESNSQVSVEWLSGKLMARVNPSNTTELIPICKDGFRMSGGFLHISRNKKGKISGGTISVNRARNVPFKKIR